MHKIPTLFLNVNTHQCRNCNTFIFMSGERVWGRDPFFERASEDVPSQARRVRAKAFIAGAADQQDPAAVSESPGRQRAPPEAAAAGEGLSNQGHHQQVSSVPVDMWGCADLTSKPTAEYDMRHLPSELYLPSYRPLVVNSWSRWRLLVNQ